MFSNYKNSIGLTVLTIVLLLEVPSMSIAQDMSFDGLPPQPAQVILPEEVPTDTPKAVVETVTSPAAAEVSEPTAPLNELEPEPEPEPEMSVTEYQEPVPKSIPHSGTYYDSNSIGPSDLGRSAGPRKVDPLYEPGSSFVVVQKNASASSRQATIVAAQRALKLGRYSSALELYEKLYKKNSRDGQVLMGLAVAQQYNGFTESAIATYEELLKREPRNAGAMVNLMGLLEKRKPQFVLEKLQSLWAKNSQNPAVAAQLGLINAKLGDYDSSTRYLGIAASLDPNNPQHYYNLAVVLDQAKSHVSAIEYYQKALERDASHGGGGSIPRDVVYDRLAELRRL